METNNTTVNVMPRIGDIAPSFTAKTTQGVINFPSDYKGRWEVDYTLCCLSCE